MVRDYYFIFTAKYAAFRVFYGRTAGIVPIIEVFVAKVIPIGTGIAFMMGIVGLSLPEATLLKKVMTWRLIGVFLAPSHCSSSYWVIFSTSSYESVCERYRQVIKNG